MSTPKHEAAMRSLRRTAALTSVLNLIDTEGQDQVLDAAAKPAAKAVVAAVPVNPTVQTPAEVLTGQPARLDMARRLLADRARDGRRG